MEFIDLIFEPMENSDEANPSDIEQTSTFDITDAIEKSGGILPNAPIKNDADERYVGDYSEDYEL